MSQRTDRFLAVATATAVPIKSDIQPFKNIFQGIQ